MRGLLVFLGLVFLAVATRSVFHYSKRARKDATTDPSIAIEAARPRTSNPRSSSAEKGGTPVRDIGGLPASQFWIHRDYFLPATDRDTVTAEAATYLAPSEEVFGVVVKGEARAYPIRFLAYHHVVNDRVGDVPIAVTY